MKQERKELGQWICHASHLFRREMDRSIANASPDDTDTALSGRNFWVLRYLKDHEGEDVFRRDLETAFKVRRSTISKMMDLMRQKQLVEEEPVNGDARLKRLILTEKSEAVLQRVSHGAETVESRLREAFSEDDYRTLVRLLDRACAVLETPTE